MPIRTERNASNIHNQFGINILSSSGGQTLRPFQRRLRPSKRLMSPHMAAACTRLAPMGARILHAAEPNRRAQVTMLIVTANQVTGNHLRSNRPVSTPIAVTSGDIKAVMNTAVNTAPKPDQFSVPEPRRAIPCHICDALSYIWTVAACSPRIIGTR